MYSANQNHILLMGDKGRIELEPATRYDGNHMWTGRDGREQRDHAAARPGQDAVRRPARPPRANASPADREPIVSGEEGLRDMRIVEAIYRSAREGRTVRL